MTPGIEDFKAIRESIGRIRTEEGPRCPVSTIKSLYTCLREQAKCPSHCPHQDQWIGPQA